MLRVLQGLPPLLAYLVLAAGLQWLSGSYASECNGYDDEPSHYVTGLMVRDYVAGWFPDRPLRFAENYYIHYPKVAFGHWPPVFYLAEGGWMLLVGDSRASVLVLMSIVAAVLAFTLFRLTAVVVGKSYGFAAGVVLLLLPITQAQTSVIMVEVPLALLSFLALWKYVRFLESGRGREAVWFGVLASAAILTKGDGIALAGVPPLAVVLSGQFQRIKSTAFWVPAIIVAITCGPFYGMTLDLARYGWVGGPTPSTAYFVLAIARFSEHLLSIFGFALLALSLCGLASAAAPCFRGGRMRPAWAAVTAFVVSVLVFQCIVPASTEPRKLFMLVPAMLLLAAAGARWVGELPLLAGIPRPVRMPALAGLVLGAFFVQTFYIPERPSRGFREVARYLESRPEFNGAALLVSSNEKGEGALTSEIAALDRPRPSHYVLRASKQLAIIPWDGTTEKLRYHTPKEVEAALEAVPVSAVILHRVVGRRERAHNQLLRATIAAFPLRWEAIYTVSRRSMFSYPVEERREIQDEIQVFRLRRNANEQPPQFQLYLDKLKKTLASGLL